MTTPITPPPTLAGFIAWTRDVMGVPTTAIPDNDPGYQTAYDVAIELVPETLNTMSPLIYTLTVYNWGGSQLLQFQQDITGQTFFADLRKAFGINSFVAGVITSAADSSTSESLAVGKGLQNLDMLSLQRIKDPYGRQAVAYMQSLGTLWGLT
jgi:hypothetical protein